MPESEALIARIEKLEEQIVHQDRAIEDLNAMITEQWKQLESFKRDIARMTDQLHEFETGTDRAGQREPPPPHY